MILYILAKFCVVAMRFEWSKIVPGTFRLWWIKWSKRKVHPRVMNVRDVDRSESSIVDELTKIPMDISLEIASHALSMEDELSMQQTAHEFRRKKLYTFAKQVILLRRKLRAIGSHNAQRKLLAATLRKWRSAYILEEFSKSAFVETWHRTKLQRRVLRGWVGVSRKMERNVESFHIVR